MSLSCKDRCLYFKLEWCIYHFTCSSWIWGSSQDSDQVFPFVLLSIFCRTVEVTKDETNFLSPEFQPLHYLTEAHKESSFDQLKQGLTYVLLIESEQRSYRLYSNISETVKDDQSTIKTLVHDNFGAFVNARMTIKTLNNILDNKSALSNSELSLTKPVNDLASIAQTMIEPLQQQRKVYNKKNTQNTRNCIV